MEGSKETSKDRVDCIVLNTENEEVGGTEDVP